MHLQHSLCTRNGYMHTVHIDVITMIVSSAAVLGLGLVAIFLHTFPFVLFVDSEVVGKLNNPSMCVKAC